MASIAAEAGPGNPIVVRASASFIGRETKLDPGTAMMATTHAFVSLAVAVVSLPVLSEYASPPLVLGAAFLGGIAPDLDLVAHHRKTLHYPLLTPALAVGLAAVAVATSSAPATLAAIGVGSAAVHAAADVFGGSPEREPWDPSLERAVYNHLFGYWHPARRYVRYSGAPEDFVVGLAFAAVAVGSSATSTAVDLSILCLVGFTALYSWYRKRLHRLTPVVELLRPVARRVAGPVTCVDDDGRD